MLANQVHQAEPVVVVLKMQRLAMTNYNYLIVDRCSGKAVIVDPAWQIDKVYDVLADEGVELAGILITHSHPDHLNLAAPLADVLGCPIWMSRREAEVCTFSHPQLILIDTAPWTVGTMRIEPLWTPGHTPGCVCYRIGENLFTGDVLFAEGCGMCPDSESARVMFDSLEYLKSLISSDTRIFPGHSYGVAPGQYFSNVLQNNIYLQFSTRESFVAFRMRRQQAKLPIFGN
jgi:hydroxyacylglutathione hydrolase